MRGSRTTATRSHCDPVGHGRERVLRVQPQPLLPRQHAQRGTAGERGELVEAGREQRRVAAELVHDEPGDAGLVGRVQHGERAEEVGEHAAAVDVADDHDRQVGGLRETHVRDVVAPQVDLGGRAGALADHHVEAGAQVGEARGDDVEQRSLPLLVGPRADRAVHPAAHHDLGAAVAARLEQHGVERDARREAARERLHRLCAPDLAAVERDDGVVRHVLRLERRHRHTPARQQPADPGDQGALAGVRGRSRHQQSALHQASMVGP
jgi:hypothetical protein